MKKTMILIGISLMLLWILSGCASSTSQTNTDVMENSSQPSNGEMIGCTGQLTVQLDFTRSDTIASGQYAVWIESDTGELVKTLYVSDFTANGGYAYRKDSIPSWVAKANPEQMSNTQIDAISSATPQSGIKRYVWDGTDETGSEVAAGIYHIYVEGTLYWSSAVLFSGNVEWGGPKQSIVLTASYTEENTTENKNMLMDVTVEYSSDK